MSLHRPHRPSPSLALALALGLACATSVSFMGCKSEGTSPPAPIATGPAGPAIPFPAGAQRLTKPQYTEAIHDIFGADVVVPPALEPDVAAEGFESVGATGSTVSARGIEQYESAAQAIAKQVTSDPKLLGRVLACSPSSPTDIACARTFVSSLGERIYRRPLSEAETTKLMGIVTSAARSLGTFEKGAFYGIATMLQSPQFLYRPVVGEPDPEHPGTLRFTPLELASRLSFFLWNSTPDDALLEAAKSGKLSADADVEKQVSRMLASPKARAGLRNFVTEWLRLADLDLLQKDAKLFTTYTADLGPMAREETLRLFEDLTFEQDADIREALTTRRTFVTPKLASMYQVPAPSPTDFAPVELPERTGRRGLLGQVAFLSLYAHPTTTSATLRGKFVREKLLCTPIRPPPVNLNTALPEPSESAKTLRQRVTLHSTDPSCAACHSAMDPIGLGFEQFDGIGRFRTKENGALIDASGDLDGVPFQDASSLAQAIHDSPVFPACITRKLFVYATGSLPTKDLVPTADALNERFVASGYRMKVLMATVARSPAFRAFVAH